jgi:signal peptidase I
MGKAKKQAETAKKVAEAESAAEAPDGGIRVWVEAILIAVLFLQFANTFVLQTFYIPSGSMEETLLIGDHLFVNRYIYGQAPTGLEKRLLPSRPVRRGDILVFRSVEEPGVDVVKRCIGLPGDRVEISSKHLYLNGERVEDDAYVLHRDPAVIPNSPRFAQHPLAKRDNFGPVVVPEDHLFCMGDNRDASHDSRFWGPLPMSHVKGRAFLIYWSYGGETPDGQWRGYGAKIGQVLSTLVGFPTKTRWARTCKLIR